MNKIRIALVLMLAGSAFAANANDELWKNFLTPPRESRPWTYWFWSNSLTDRETIVDDLNRIDALGFGGLLLTDSRGYWDDEQHVINPPAEIKWGSDEWIELMSFVVREAAKRKLSLTMNVAASGGHLRGEIDVGGDNPKVLVCRRYAPGARFEKPASEHYRELAVFAVKTAQPLQFGDWVMAGDGLYSMSATSGRRIDPANGGERIKALEIRQLESAAQANLPAGNWTILRFGYDTIPNAPNDIDVLDSAAVKRHLERVFGKLIAKVPEFVGADKTLTCLYNVSWEGAMPTWCETFDADFRQITGRELRPLMPILAGFDIANVDSAAFMRDFRRVRGELMRKKLYGAVREWAHERGMLACSESGGPWQRKPEVFGECDQLAFLAENDIPQGEFWPMIENGLDRFTGHANANGRFIDRGIASAAHIYGRRLCSAEAFTHMHRHWSVDPAFLKPLGDQAYADGVNLMVWHTYTTAPKKYGVPGLEYFAGSHINRNVTWHDELSPFITYLARCQSLLQAGEPVTDIAVLCGSRPYVDWGVSKTAGGEGNGRMRNVVSKEIDLKIPNGFAFDLVNDDAIAKDPGLLARYRVVFDAREPFKPGTEIMVKSLLPDVETTADWTWCHRRIRGEVPIDIYFLAGEGKAKLTFRSANRHVEIWNAVNGERMPADAQANGDGRTVVQANLPIGGSCFVVFSDKSSLTEKEVIGEWKTMGTIDGEWSVTFRYHDGIAAEPPKGIQLTELADFTSRDDIRNFAGKATYRTAFKLTERREKLRLSLGKVPTGLAHVYVNGKDCGTVWCAPWEADIAKAVKIGENQLEIRYTNNWYNRLVGDCALSEDRRVTKSVLRYWNIPRKGNPDNSWSLRPTVYSGYSAHDKLQPSGLLGPITLKTPRVASKEKK